MFIAEKGLEIETVNISIRDGEQLSEEYRKINPYCTLPALQLDDGTSLLCTNAIRAYLEAVHPTPALLGRDAKEKGVIADILWHMEFEGSTGMAEALRNRSKAMVDRALPGPVNYAQIPELAERGQAKVLHYFDGVDDLIGDKEFVAGDHISAADIDLFVLVDFAGWLKMGLPEGADRARRWYEMMSKRPSASL
jgi:glutathione S-transferase